MRLSKEARNNIDDINDKVKVLYKHIESAISKSFPKISLKPSENIILQKYIRKSFKKKKIVLKKIGVTRNIHKLIDLRNKLSNIEEILTISILRIRKKELSKLIDKIQKY